MCRIYKIRFEEYLSERKISEIIPQFAGIKAVSERYNESHTHSVQKFREADVLVSLLENTNNQEIAALRPSIPFFNFKELVQLRGSEENAFDYLVNSI